MADSGSGKHGEESRPREAVPAVWHIRQQGGKGKGEGGREGGPGTRKSSYREYFVLLVASEDEEEGEEYFFFLSMNHPSNSGSHATHQLGEDCASTQSIDSIDLGGCGDRWGGHAPMSTPRRLSASCMDKAFDVGWRR